MTVLTTKGSYRLLRQRTKKKSSQTHTEMTMTTMTTTMTMTIMLRFMKNHLYPTFLRTKLRANIAIACVKISRKKRHCSSRCSRMTFPSKWANTWKNFRIIRKARLRYLNYSKNSKSSTLRYSRKTCCSKKS